MIFYMPLFHKRALHGPGCDLTLSLSSHQLTLSSMESSSSDIASFSSQIMSRAWSDFFELHTTLVSSSFQLQYLPCGHVHNESIWSVEEGKEVNPWGLLPARRVVFENLNSGFVLLKHVVHQSQQVLDSRVLGNLQNAFLIRDNALLAWKKNMY